MSNEQEPKIEFPCLYPIKIIGVAEDDFQQAVLAKVEKHAGKIDPDQITANFSKNRNYLSVRVNITATGKEQLQALFTDLKTLASVKMVL